MQKLLLFFALFSFTMLNAQNPEWRVFYHNPEIGNAVLAGENIWFASYPMGVVKMNRNDGSWENFSSLNTSLPNNGIFDIEVDAQNRIWMSMYIYEPSFGEGLMVYDNGNWNLIQQLPDGALIQQPRISKDCAGQIWLSCDKGAFSIENTNLIPRNNDFDGAVPVAYCNTNGVVDYWWGNYGELKRSTSNNATIYQFPDSLKSLPAPVNIPTPMHFVKLNPVYAYGDSKLLVRTDYCAEENDDLYFFTLYYNYENGHWTRTPAPLGDPNQQCTILHGKDGQLYISQYHNLFSFDEGALNQIFIPGLNFSEHSIVDIDSEGNIWLQSSLNDRTLKKANQTGVVNFPSFGNNPFDINPYAQLFYNTKHELWVFDETGISRIVNNTRQYFAAGDIGTPPLSGWGKKIVDVYFDLDGNPWVTLNNLSQQFFPAHWDGNQWIEYDKQFNSIAFDPDGSTIWYVSLDRKLHRRNGATDQTFDHENTPILPVYGLRALKCDADGNLWGIDNNSGDKFYRRHANGTWETYLLSKQTYNTCFGTAFTTDKQGNLYYSDDHNILKFSENAWERVDSSWGGWDHIKYRGLSFDANNKLWVGSWGKLLGWDGVNLEKIDLLGEELPHSDINSLVIDTLGNFWMTAHYYGLVAYHKGGLDLNGFSTATSEPPTSETNFISPNPFLESTVVDLDKLDFKPERYELYNANGVLLHSVDIRPEANNLVIRRNGMPSGLYFIVLKGEGKFVAGKVIAQ